MAEEVNHSNKQKKKEKKQPYLAEEKLRTLFLTDVQ